MQAMFDPVAKKPERREVSNARSAYSHPPLKILLVNKFYYLNGGSERVLFQERDYFRRLGHQVVDFSMQHPRNIDSAYASFFIPQVEYDGDQSLWSKIRNTATFIHSPLAVSRLRKLVEKERPDIVHLHNIYHQITPSIIPMLKKQGLKIVLSLHDYKLICPSYTMLNKEVVCDYCRGYRFHGPLVHHCQGSRAKELLLSAEAYYHKWRKSYEAVDMCIAPSQFMADRISARIPAERITVIRNGIEGDQYVPTWDDKGYALYVGRVSRQKGIETLCKAHAALGGAIPLKIVGTGPLLAELERRYPDVELLGYRSGDELRECVGSASFVVLPSEWYENCPMSALETMALGKPMIAAAIGGLPEIIDEGVTGLLFASGSVSDLADKMLRLWRDEPLRRRMGFAAKAKQLKRHINQVRQEAVLDVYYRLLGHERPTRGKVRA